MRARSFEKLPVWRRSVDLVVAVYRVSNLFPAEEKSGMTATLRRSAAAIPAKIADGHGRPEPADVRKSLTDVLGSLRELRTHILVAERLHFVRRMRTSRVHWRINRLRRMVQRDVASLEPEARDPVAAKSKPIEGHLRKAA